VYRYGQRTVDVSSWLGDSVQVAFRVVGTNGADFAVDDILTGDLAAFPVVPSNDACVSADPLPAGGFVFLGNTCSATNNLNPYHANSFSCASDDLSGGDVFYSLTAAVGDTLDLNLAGDWQAGLYLMSVCDTAVTSCVAASKVLEVSDTSSVATLHHVFATPGTYYLGVDGIGGECGEFRLTGSYRGSVTAVTEGGSPSAVITLSVSPNPARAVVTFSCEVPSSGLGPGTVTIFDAAGRRIWWNNLSASGGRLVSAWDGRSRHGGRVPSGTYIVRAQFSNGMVADSRMVLLD